MIAHRRPPDIASSLLAAAILLALIASGPIHSAGQEPSSEPIVANKKPRKYLADLVAATRAREIDNQNRWAIAIRHLVRLGKPVVPLLIDELDRTSDERLLRSLGFTLRAIGDPRAVPALIRAIPRTLGPPGSDYGATTDDAELLAFMQEHDLDKGRGGRLFSFGMPFREITGALHTITGQRFNEDELNFVTLMGGAEQHRVQRLLFQKLAARWAAWWEANWQHFTKEPAYAKVNLPPMPEAARPHTLADQPFPTGPRVKASGAWSNVILGPPQSLDYYRSFEDLDSGRMLKWPDELGPPEKAKPAAVAAWAAQEGYDLQGTEFKQAGSTETFFALRGLGLRAWQAENGRFGTIEEELRNGLPKLGRPAGDLLMDFDPKTKTYHPENEATFLFVTREGATGVLQVAGQITEIFGPADIGRPAQPKANRGFYRGVQFQFKLLYEQGNEGGREMLSADDY
jgi:hypothetical protein